MQVWGSPLAAAQLELAPRRLVDASTRSLKVSGARPARGAAGIGDSAQVRCTSSSSPPWRRPRPGVPSP